MRSLFVHASSLSLPDRDDIPAWLSPINPEFVSVQATGYGWPQPILVNEETGIPPTKAELEREVTVDDFCSAGFDARSIVLSRVEVMPFHGLEFRLGGRVYFHGFCFNTAIYAVAIFALMIAAATTRHAIRRRIRPHACVKCNYDLRGLPRMTSGSPAVCPECGSPVLPSPPASPVGSQAEERACQGVVSR